MSSRNPNHDHLISRNFLILLGNIVIFYNKAIVVVGFLFIFIRCQDDKVFVKITVDVVDHRELLFILIFLIFLIMMMMIIMCILFS